MHSLPRNILDNLEPLVAELQRHFDGGLLLLLADEVSHHGRDVVLAAQPLALLGAQEPHVVGGLLDLVLVLGLGPGKLPAGGGHHGAAGAGAGLPHGGGGAAAASLITATCNLWRSLARPLAYHGRGVAAAADRTEDRCGGCGVKYGGDYFYCAIKWPQVSSSRALQCCSAQIAVL